MTFLTSQLFLFGGDRPWSPQDWTASDDRVRGGSSVSTLDCSPSSPIAVFNGNLDISTLGGAGFASQRTTGEDKTWDLSNYDGLKLNISKSDGKRYTFIVKDQLLSKSPDGREQSTVSWEYDFNIENDAGESETGKVFIAWNDLKPTYRGREKKDAKPLDRRNIKRFSIMIRSFFGTQEGDFSLSVISIAASSNSSSALDPGRAFPKHYKDDPKQDTVTLGEGMLDIRGSSNPSKARGCLGSCTVS